MNVHYKVPDENLRGQYQSLNNSALLCLLSLPEGEGLRKHQQGPMAKTTVAG